MPSRAPASATEQLAVFRHAAVDLIEERELRARLEASLRERRPLRVKFGMDPTSPDLHVGHAVVLTQLRAVQDLGHVVVLIVGDATAMVGDPSGRNKLRPPLSRADVDQNLQTYVDQVGHVLDLERTEIRRNSEWFDQMGFEDVLRLLGRATVARMLERDTFELRMRENEPIGLHELLYPLMQAWDSVMIRADVEYGGTDQLFNLLRGRDLQEQSGQAPQVCVTTPLINGTDGRKMSKSYGNAIGLTEAPKDMFGKVMRVDDAVLGDWFRLLTAVPAAEVAQLLAGPYIEAKQRLGEEITARFHGREAAIHAREAFVREVRNKELPDEIPDAAWPASADRAGVPLMLLLKELGLAASSSEARRLVEGGGVKLDGAVEKDPKRLVAPPAAPLLIQAGKRRFVRLRG
jgi:tyrosyl-tRNA synthetase